MQCDYPKIAVAFELLLKYLTNLLSERLPQNWWSINAKLPQFVHRIGNVNGAKEVLKTAGYCVEEVGTLSFPEDKRKMPDRELLSVVSAELLIAKAECERARRGGCEWLPSPLRQRQRQDFVKKASPEEDKLRRNLSDIPAQPPHPNQWTGHNNLSHPEGPHNSSVQPSSHFQSTSSPNAEEHQQPVVAATHSQHVHITNRLPPEESLGFRVSPSPDYSDDSAGLGRHRHHQERPSPSDLSRSFDDRPHSRGRDFVCDGGLTTEQPRRTGQEAFQQIDQLEQATGEEQATREGVEEKREEAVEEEQEEAVEEKQQEDEEALQEDKEEELQGDEEEELQGNEEEELQEDEEEELREDVEDCQESGTAG